jgi:hypothetical protein
MIRQIQKLELIVSTWYQSVSGDLRVGECANRLLQSSPLTEGVSYTFKHRLSAATPS